MQNKQESAQKSSETDPILDSKNKAPTNRAALNWRKVRNLLLNKNKPVEVSRCGINIPSLKQCQKIPQKHSKNLIRTSKNNLYSLFDVKQSKQIQVPTSLFNESVKLDILNENTIQTVIETVYKIKINIKRQQTNCQLTKFHAFELRTQTPVPNLEKIISSTEGQSFKNTQNNKVLVQIDTTGFWIWQAEEILTYFLIKQYERFSLIRQNNKLENTETKNQNKDLLINFNQIKTILELGAGSSGLASLASWKILTEIALTKQSLHEQTDHYTPSILITDGKKENILYLKRNIELNKKQSNPYVQEVQNKNNSGGQMQPLSTIISRAEFMLWGTQVNQKYDLILSADSLFFEQFHRQLIQSLKYSMHEKSIALFVNPKRGNSMNNFIKLAQIQKFSVSFIQFSDLKFNTQVEKVKQSQQYDPDRHLYYFLCVRKQTIDIRQSCGLIR